MTTLYKLSIHSQSLEMRGIFLVSRYVGTINQLSVRQKFFCWFSLVFQKESAIQLSKPILQHLQGGPLFMNHPVGMPGRLGKLGTLGSLGRLGARG